MSHEADGADSARRKQILDAALAVFTRFGYRKTTMDDVARTADVSRPGLYFLFANKQTLFRAAMRKALDDGMVAAAARLEQPGLVLEERLVLAFDEWMGRFVGIGSGDASDLFERSGALLGSLLTDYHAAFEERLALAVDEAGLADEISSGADIASTLYRCAAGWKHGLLTREQFCERMRVVVQVIVMPRRAMAPGLRAAAA